MTDMSRAAPVRPASPGAHVHGTLPDTLRLAASRGQLEVVKDLLARGAGIDPDRDGRTALHFAAQEGHADVCKYLVTQGCEPDMQDVMGYSPLLRAASQGAHDAVQVLLDAGCDPNIQDEHGNAAIHEACWNGFSKTAELLVKYNCNVFLTNKAGFTALHLAAQNGHNESSRVLLYAGCNPDLKNNYGDTALHTAARYGHAGVARILISAKCKLSEQNKNGDSSLHIAAALKRRKIAKILVESGIDTDLVNKQDEKAIDVARRKEHPEIELIISALSKPRPSSFRTRHGEHIGVTFKDEIDIADGPVVCPDDEPPLKPEPKADKQEKERRFFFFKKKKKDKDKEKEKTPTTPTTTRKKGPELFHPNQTKTPVHGFFSQYVPRDGVQFYRDLAGNIKQGPIGYAPVCQCGPSLKRLENSITDTRDSLHNHIDASHQVLSQRIENIDIRTKQQGYATDTMVQERFSNERRNCHARISERLQEERLETRALVDQVNAGMKEELEYWLSDKLASYGHCLDHHHDDSALPPRNLFLDFPMGRLFRSRSDETLSASDCSGKFRKKDFYASRQAAMQQIRGWDVSTADRFSNRERTSRRERNNNVIPANNKIVTHAQVHSKGSDRQRDTGHHVDHRIPSNEPDILSPSTNSTTSPGTMGSSMNAGNASNSGGQHAANESSYGYASVSRRGHPAWRSMDNETPRRDMGFQHGAPHGSSGSQSQSRVTFSQDQQWQQHQWQHHQPQQQHYQHRVSSPSPHQQASYRSGQDPCHQSRQSMRYTARITSPDSQHNKNNLNSTQQNLQASSHRPQTLQQNLPAGGPPDTDIKSGEKEGSRIPPLTGQETSFVGSNGRGSQRLTRYQDGYGVQYNRPRTLSTDSLLNEDNTSHSQHISRCRSVENTLDEKDQRTFDGYNSGYVTDSAVRPASGGGRFSNNNRSVRDTHSASPAARMTTRYRLPETSAGSGSSPNHPPSNIASQYIPAQQDPHSQSFTPRQGQNNVQSPGSMRRPPNRTDPSSRFHNVSREFVLAKQQHKSMHGLNSSSNANSPDFNTFGKSDSVRNSSDRSALGSKSDSNIAASQSQSTHFTPPLKECLQHETLVPSNAVSPPAYVAGNKEDSTCSSNQDSGYGSRNHGGGGVGRRGADTSGGTPSSSFSMERSSCNTPSNAGSPYTTQGELTNSDLQSQQQANNGNLFQYPLPASHQNNGPHLQDGVRTDSPIRGNGFEGNDNNLNGSTRASLRNDIYGTTPNKYSDSHESSIPYARASQYPPFQSTHANFARTDNSARFSNNDHTGFYHNASSNPGYLQGQTQNERTPRETGASEYERQRYIHNQGGSISYNKPEPMKRNSYEYTNRSSTPGASGYTNTPQSQTPRDSSSSTFSRPLQTPNGSANNNPASSLNTTQNSNSYDKNQNDQSSVPQAAVQAHIEGWYQRKLMEAAQRLRQNQSYNQPGLEHKSLYNSKEDLTYSPRQGYVGDQHSGANHSQNQYQSYNPRSDTPNRSSNMPSSVRSPPSSVLAAHHQHQSSMEGSFRSSHTPNPRERFEQRGSNNYNSQALHPQNRNVNSVRDFYDRNSNNMQQSAQAYNSINAQNNNVNSRNSQNNNMNSQNMPIVSKPILRYDPVRGSDV